MIQKPVIIVGGGIAGLACGVTLVKNGVVPLIIERRPYLGGRATTQPTSPPFDNGPHMITAGYRHLRQLLEIAGKPLHFNEETPDIVWYDSKLKKHVLHGGSKSKMLLSFIREFGWNSIALLYRLTTLDNQSFSTVGIWLEEKSFPKNVEHLLRLFVISTMNTEAEDADFSLFQAIIRESLLCKTKGSVLQRFTPLETAFVSPLREYMERAGVVLITGKQVLSIESSDNEWCVTTGTEKYFAKQVVLAIPSYARASFLPEPETDYSPIVTVRLAVTGIEPGWFGFDEGQVHWVFVNSETPRILEATTSADEAWAASDKEFMVSQVVNRIKQVAPTMQVEKVFGVVKEMRATPKQTAKWQSLRPTPLTDLPGLWRTGDDLATGLPATIESAAKAGIWTGLCVTGKLQGKAEEACSSRLDIIA